MLPLRGARPSEFLRLVQGEPRGFWARGERWVAHSGSLATISIGREEAGDRFARVREIAHGLVDQAVDISSEGSKLLDRARWFGGFSFRSDHHATGRWEAFPCAHFILPRMELEGDATGIVRLRLRRAVGEHQSLEKVRAELDAELAALASRLEGAGGSNGSLPVPLERHEIERGPWEEAVEKALDSIQEGRLSKAVLARTLEVTAASLLDPVDVVDALWRENRGSHVFLYEPRSGEALVGAAPETVATLGRGVFHVTAVAGSIRRGETPEESAELGRRLLASEKDRAEQRIVVEDMVARLREMTDDVTVQDEPHVLELARIQHLETEIRGRLGPALDVLAMIEALHPTPAVCGVPRDQALEFLLEEEPFERGWYAGPVGWFDLEGNGVFAPALRCAVTRGREWRLFAGAGIVAGSNPAAEWDETRIKFEPVLRALAAVSAGSSAAVGSSDEEEASR